MNTQRVTAASGPWLLHNTEQTRQIEAQAINARPTHTLMQSAGLAVARLAQALVPHAAHVQVFAGPGNNGGDGAVAATLLHQRGCQVSLSLLADAAHLPADAAQALAEAHAAGVPINTALPAVDTHCDLRLDALLGLGVNRPPEGLVAEAIKFIVASNTPVLAVDLPSGLNADTGAVMGHAVRATATLALLTLKPGLFTASGRDHAGEVWLDNLGVSTDATPGVAWLAGESHSTWPARQHAQHKGSFGDVAVVGGATGMTGAAWLAAQAALAAGAGRVFCSLLDEHAAGLLPQRPELMGRAAWWLSAPPLLARSTVVCGCGGGDAVRHALPPLLAHSGRLVLDADALNAIAADTSLQRTLRARSDRGLPTVLTPHPLEAARLLESTAAQVQADRLCAAQTLAERYACVVVLKGSGTVVAAPGTLPSINWSGNARLATAGSGDVLAGWIAGTWSAATVNAQQAALASVWLHGHAADDAHALPMRANDLIEAMVRVLSPRTGPRR